MPRNRYITAKKIISILAKKHKIVTARMITDAIKVTAGCHPRHTVRPYIELMIEFGMIQKHGDKYILNEVKDDTRQN